MNYDYQKYSSDYVARKYIIEPVFNGYVKRQQDNELYSKDYEVPQALMETYFTFVDRLDINEMFGNFKKEYIYNENKFEQVHEPLERAGLAKVYDLLQNINDFSNVSIYKLIDIHKALYSEVPNKEYGGKTREELAHIDGAPINLVAPEDIVMEMNKLYLPSKELAKQGMELATSHDATEIRKYIDDCVELNCAIVKIHPFGDGNGRSSRALMNLYFKIANIPPVYVTNKEKTEYKEAMQKAICDKEYNPDFTSIKKFYYYKICDSIIKLDILQENKRQKQEERTK